MEEPDAIPPLQLSDGRVVSVCTADDPIRLRIGNGASINDSLEIPYPGSGFAGGYLIASPRETFVAFSFYSGQSEECFQIFRLKPRLEQVVAIEYMCGEASSCVFSPDEEILAFALPFSCSEWWQPWDDEDTELDGSGRPFFDFGVICIQPTAGGDFSTHTLRVTLPNSWEPEREDYDPFLKPEFRGTNSVLVSMPWGREVFSLPLDPVICLSPETGDLPK